MGANIDFTQGDVLFRQGEDGPLYFIKQVY